MKLLERIKNIVEEKGDKEEYQKFFNKTLKKYGVDEPDKLSKEDAKKFYDEIDAGWEADDKKKDANEGREIKRVVRGGKRVKKVK